jgi:hypothetical protein
VASMKMAAFLYATRLHDTISQKAVVFEDNSVHARKYNFSLMNLES